METTEITVRVKKSASDAALEVRAVISITVLQLKQKVSPLIGSPPATFELLFGEDRLENEKTLEDCHLPDRVLLSVGYRQASIRIPVMKATGEMSMMSAGGDWTMKTLKTRVSAQMNVPEDSVKVMDDSEEIAAPETRVDELNSPQIAISAALHGG